MNCRGTSSRVPKVIFSGVIFRGGSFVGAARRAGWAGVRAPGPGRLATVGTGSASGSLSVSRPRTAIWVSEPRPSTQASSFPWSRPMIGPSMVNSSVTTCARAKRRRPPRPEAGTSRASRLAGSGSRWKTGARTCPRPG